MGMFSVGKVEVARTQPLPLEELKALIDRGLGAKYETVVKGKSLYVKKSDWCGVGVRTSTKDKTKITVTRAIPEMKNRLMLLPLLLIAIIPGVVANLVMISRAAPVEEEVVAYLEQHSGELAQPTAAAVPPQTPATG